MIAHEARPQAFLVSRHSGHLPKPIPIAVEIEDGGPNPDQTLADLYRRCADGGGCPYTMDQIIGVLAALRYHGPVVATDIAHTARMPASAVYGCVLELEDYGLVRWIPEPVTTADNVTAEITAHGARFVREINTASAGERYARYAG